MGGDSFVKKRRNSLMHSWDLKTKFVQSNRWDISAIEPTLKVYHGLCFNQLFPVVLIRLSVNQFTSCILISRKLRLLCKSKVEEKSEGKENL